MKIKEYAWGVPAVARRRWQCLGGPGCRCEISIPAQWVRDPALPQLWLRSQPRLGSDPGPWNPYVAGWSKKERGGCLYVRKVVFWITQVWTGRAHLYTGFFNSKQLAFEQCWGLGDTNPPCSWKCAGNSRAGPLRLDGSSRSAVPRARLPRPTRDRAAVFFIFIFYFF